MKRALSFLTAFLVLLNSFSLISFADEISLDTNEVLNYRTDFLWGQNTHGNERGIDADPEYVEEKIYYAAKQGIKLLRYQGNYIDGDFTTTDYVVGLCNKYGIKVMLCLWPHFGLDEPTQEDLDYITKYTNTYANRYNGKDGRGKVDYFQLWNEEEVGIMEAKQGVRGATTGDLIDYYYTVSVEGKEDLVEWTKHYKAACKGIREADTDAKIIINFGGTCFGPIRYYVQEGVDFDIIGWDWYGVKTNDYEEGKIELQEVVYGWRDANNNFHAGLREVFPDKDVIICEGNLSMNHIQDFESLYTDPNFDYDLLVYTWKWLYQQDWVKGYCAYQLTDMPSHTQEHEKHYGHIRVEKGGKIIEPKPLYYLYQKIIGGNENLPMQLQSSIDLKPYEIFKVYTSTDESYKPDTQNPNLQDNYLPTIKDNYFDNETDNSEQIESTDKEVIVEDVVIEPENIYKKATTTVTQRKLPWALLISVGGGMLVLFGAGFATFLIIKKKKGL